MIAEQRITEMQTQIDALFQDQDPHEGQIEALHNVVQQVADMKDTLGDALRAKLAESEIDMNIVEGDMLQSVTEAQKKVIDIKVEQKEICRDPGESNLSLRRCEG